MCPPTPELPDILHSSILEKYWLDSQPFAVGGFSSVFLGSCRSEPSTLLQGGPKVVVKMVALGNRKAESKFKNELATMEGLQHPNICTLLETFETPHAGFFVLEYCEGGELFERILKDGRLAEPRAADVIKHVMVAMQYAHQQGVVHRDLKPENVCLCSRDSGDTRVKVIDWGVASRGDPMRMTSVVGSVDYIAPEVMEATRFRPYTSACDAWSLGVLTYVVLSATHPFSGRNKCKRLAMMKNSQYVMKGAKWNPVSVHAYSFIRGLLSPSPELRTSIDEAITHPFLTRSKDRSSEIPPLPPRLLGSSIRHAVKKLGASAIREIHRAPDSELKTHSHRRSRSSSELLVFASFLAPWCCWCGFPSRADAADANVVESTLVGVLSSDVVNVNAEKTPV